MPKLLKMETSMVHEGGVCFQHGDIVEMHDDIAEETQRWLDSGTASEADADAKPKHKYPLPVRKTPAASAESKPDGKGNGKGNGKGGK